MIKTPSARRDILPSPIARDRRAEMCERLLKLMSELTEAMEKENCDLAAGFPASIAPGMERKLELVAAYSELYDQLREAYPDLLSSPGHLTERMMKAVLRLRDVTNENLARLDAAADASRRRVEAVLSAALSAHRGCANYSASGELPIAARLAAFTRDCRA